jgi:hypothetical protein
VRRGLIGVATAVTLGLSASAAQAVTPVTCAGLSAAMNSAAAGQVLELPPGTCAVNITVTDTNAFTLEGATSGAPTVLVPVSGDTSTPIIQSADDVRFTLSNLELTGATGGALSLFGTGGEGVTVSHDLFTNDTGTALRIGETSSAAQPTLIENSTFSHDSGGEGGGIQWVSGQPLVLSGNTFTADNATDGADGGGGILIWNDRVTGSTSSVKLSGNLFGGPSANDGDTAESSAGGAFISLAGGQSLTLTGNTFENDRISGTNPNPAWRVGGGLFLDAGNGDSPFKVNQSHDVFRDNVINEPASGIDAGNSTGGAGEWIIGLSVTSTADSFIGNRITVNNGAPPEGGGVGAIAAAAINTEPALPAAFDGRDDVFTGNSTASGGWGGAIYVGIPDPVCTGNCPGSGLTLEDSTLVGNSVHAGSGSEGGAIWGSPNDTLVVRNSIIYGNTPKPEIFGFGSTGPAFAFSDVCHEAGGPAVSGSGMICASPALTAGGTETRSSPTLDAGSNALVPAGLTTDLAGHPRIADYHVTCAGPSRAIVDMGAYEATFKQIPKCSARVAILSGQLTDSHGHTMVSLSCPQGDLYCQGTVTLKTVNAYPTGAPHAHRLTLGSAAFKITHGHTGAVTVHLSTKALHQLGNAHSVKVSIAVADHDGQNDHASSGRQVELVLPSSS